MKKLSYSVLVAATTLLFSSCGNTFSNYDASTDGFERILTDVTRTVGEDGRIDEMHLTLGDEQGRKSMIGYFALDFQSSTDKNKLKRIAYHNYTGWGSVEDLEITVGFGNASAFDLSREVNSFSQITAAALKKIYETSLAKVGEVAEDIDYFSISADLDEGRDIEYNGYLKGRRKDNGVKDSFSMNFDKDGNLLEK